MENSEKREENKEIDMRIEDEFKIEKEIQADLIKSEKVEEVKEHIDRLIHLERNSKNGRAIPKIQDCMGVLNLGCTGGNIGNEIASSIAQNLYPELYRNIALKKERVEFKDLKNMATSLELLGIDLGKNSITNKKFYDGIDNLNKEMIKDAFIKLIQLLPENNE